MLNNLLKMKKTKPQNFQVLFLSNDTTDEVEVQEVKQLDFSTVMERLEQGESVFITSKASQKMKIPKNSSPPTRSYARTRVVKSFYLDHL